MNEHKAVHAGLVEAIAGADAVDVVEALGGFDAEPLERLNLYRRGHAQLVEALGGHDEDPYTEIIRQLRDAKRLSIYDGGAECGGEPAETRRDT